MAGGGGGSNTTHALLSPDPETLPMGEGVSPATGEFLGTKMPQGKLTAAPHSLFNGRSQLSSEPEEGPRHYPLGVCS